MPGRSSRGSCQCSLGSLTEDFIPTAKPRNLPTFTAVPRKTAASPLLGVLHEQVLVGRLPIN